MCNNITAFQVENEEAEKVEMEVGVRGGVYNVSSVEGMAKIIPKAQTADTVREKMVVSHFLLDSEIPHIKLNLFSNIIIIIPTLIGEITRIGALKLQELELHV